MPNEFAAGSAFKYNQTNYAVIGQIIERVTGQSFADFIVDNQLQKVGMERTEEAGFSNLNNVIRHSAPILLFSLNLIGMGAGPQIVGVLTDVLTPTYGVEAIRYSLLLTATSKMVAIALFFLAARWLVQDLKAKDEC